jgi:hypothetical protein
MLNVALWPTMVVAYLWMKLKRPVIRAMKTRETLKIRRGPLHGVRPGD